MTHRQAFTVALFLATLATATGTGTVRATKHGARRISIGTLRIHADADEVTVWRKGGPSILWTVAAPVAVALPPVAVDRPLASGSPSNLGCGTTIDVGERFDEAFRMPSGKPRRVRRVRPGLASPEHDGFRAIRIDDPEPIGVLLTPVERPL